LPVFKLPAPQPSERMNLPSNVLIAGLGPRPTQLAVGNRLEAALRASGYSEFSYYRVANGFALVARLEQFEDDGSPGPAKTRFLDPQVDQPFDLESYVQHLFFAPEGYYRLIVFIVTDGEIGTTDTAATVANARQWLRRGKDKLPPIYGSMLMTANHQLTALIYEFRKHGNDTIATLDPGRLDARTHLAKSGLYARLTGGH